MESRQSPSLFGLLYISRESERHTNLSVSASSPTDVYACNAATFLNSCRAAGMAAHILTNNKDHILGCLGRMGINHNASDFIEIEFSRNVPSGIPFRSAHYKLDALSFLGSKDAPKLSCLLDIDCVVLEKFHVPAARIYLYDISSQMTETNGRQYFAHDFAILGSTFDYNGKWYGGELISGNQENFKMLSQEIDQVWPIYLENISSLNYVGDELITSAAVGQLLKNGQVVTPNGSEMISRYWSIETVAKPSPLASSINHKVLHLPADKEYLADWARRPFDATMFRSNYLAYVQNRRRARLLRTFAKSLVKRRRYYPPRLA